MGTNRIPIYPKKYPAGPQLFACLCAGALLLAAASAVAQDAAKQAPAEQRGFFDKIVDWFSEQASHFDSGLKNAGSQVDNFGREAGIAAKTTVDAAKDAADAVGRIPNTSVLSVHEKCPVAPNGAPDCLSVAMNYCKTKGFQSGKSVDMTTAEVCPPKVLLSGRSTGPECHDETFVSRVLCQ
ncbi:MAG TPA: hypothetical protein VMI47_06490 [Pseudolabrys sp.]|nr:hypothetical protein [Pseudolabrys sp.]